MSQSQSTPRSSQLAALAPRDPVPDESAAWHRATARDVADFVRDVHDAHRPAVLSFVISIVRDPVLAEDVVQETMIRAWRTADCLSPSFGSIRGWLFRVARNIATDQFRARQCRPTEVAESAAAGMACAEDEAERLLTVLEMRRVIGQLSPIHVAALRECYYNGRTVAEAAEVLGVPVGTVKSRLYCAMRRLRALLSEPGARAALAA